MKSIIFLLLAFLLFVVEGSLFGSKKDHAVGTKEPIDLSDEGLLKAVDAGMKLLNERSNSAEVLRLGKIIKATKQVVAGLLYDVDLRVDRAECAGDNVSCPAVGQSSYHLSILSQPWSNPPYQLTSFDEVKA